MASTVHQRTRLLEMDHLADFNFIQQKISQILLDQDLTYVYSSPQGSLHVGRAYVGSVGQRSNENGTSISRQSFMIQI